MVSLNIGTESPESSTGIVQALRVVRFLQFYAVLEEPKTSPDAARKSCTNN